MARWWLRGRFKRWCKPRGSQDHRPLEAPTILTKTDAPRYSESFCMLPEDIIFLICQYLTRGEIITLMLCSTRFWRSREGAGVFADIWREITLPIGTELSKMEVRFYVLRMLEYDGLLQRGSPGKYCCWGCMNAHEQGAFLPKEFRKSVNLKAKEDYLPEEAFRRSCSAAKRYIMFGACREMSLVEIRHAIANPKTCSDDTILDKDNATFLSRDGSIFSRDAGMFDYTVRVAATVQSFSSFRRLAHRADYPLCPHLRLGDREIIQLYKKPPQPYSCKHCTTTVQINNQSVFCVSVVRHIGWLRSPTDPWWIAQSYEKRHRRLKTRCLNVSHWYEGLYSMEDCTPRYFLQRSRISRPFKGVVSCTLKGPEQYLKRVELL